MRWYLHLQCRHDDRVVACKSWRVLVQELQYENASLKAKLAELMAAQKCDKEAFDRKLG